MAARIQKLPTSIKIPKMKRTDDCIFLPLAKKKYFTGKNNRFPFLDILGYLKNTHKNAKFGRVRQVPTMQGTWLGLVSLCQIWDFYGYSLNTLKFPKMGIRYFFLCLRDEYGGTNENENSHTTQKRLSYTPLRSSTPPF